MSEPGDIRKNRPAPDSLPGDVAAERLKVGGTRRMFVPTEKGLDYQAQIKGQNLNRHFNKLKRCMKEASELMANPDATAETIRNIHSEWLELYQEFMEYFDASRPALDEESIQINSARNTQLLEFKRNIETHILATHVTKSRMNSSNGESSRSSTISEYRINELHKRAEIQAELQLLQEKQKLQAAQLQLQQQMEATNLKERLVASSLKEEALREIEEKPSSSRWQSVANRPDEQHTAAPTQSGMRQQKPILSDWQDKKKTVIYDNVSVNSMVPVNTPMVYIKDDLPSREPSKFTGEPLKFGPWLRSFETLVESKRQDPGDRLYYLGLYTSGEPHDAIQGYLLLNTENAYTEAKQLLTERYGNPVVIMHSYKTRLDKWPSLKNAKGGELQKFLDFLKECRVMMKSLGGLSLDSIDENKRITDKLPIDIANRWNRVVDSRIYEHRSPFPCFDDFVDFLIPEIRQRNSILRMKLDEQSTVTVPKRTERTRVPGANSFSSGSKEIPKNNDKTSRSKCVVCKEMHTGSLENCGTFKQMSLIQRDSALMAHGLCRGCFAFGHTKQNCRRKLNCSVCGGRHPTLLHDYNWKAKNTVVPTETKCDQPSSVHTSLCTSCISGADSTRDMNSQIVPVVVSHVDKPSEHVHVYAMIDEQSDACFVSDKLLSSLNVHSTPVQVKLSTVMGEELIQCNKVAGLVVKGANESTEIPLPGCYTRNRIPGSRSQIPHPDKVKHLGHLQKVADRLQPYQDGMEIGLLIGINCIRAVKPREIISGGEDEPYAVRTALGWGVVGCISKTELPDCKDNMTQRSFVFRTHVTEVSPAQLNLMFNQGFDETASQSKMSVEDAKFLEIAKRGIHYNDNGHFEIPLPTKDSSISLPNNRSTALERLAKLKASLKRNPKTMEEYTAQMTDMISKGYAEKIADQDLNKGKNVVWYIPHHGVRHPKKKKLRIVFDCSAEYRGESLNKHLLQGPDMINSLAGILSRFRKEPIAFTCDIQSMFHQVGVNPEDRDYLRFLWWDDSELENICDYRMTVHLFGAKSSPACVNFALKSTADWFDGDLGCEAGDFIREDFYVDDGLKSVASKQEAIDLITSSQQLCKKGGFRLHKFLSNDREVLQSVQKEDQAEPVQGIDLSIAALPVERTLGVQWSIQSDSFQFSVLLDNHTPTRRRILSTVSSVFDPLGLVGPVVLVGKQILQKICQDGLEWDDPIPEEIEMRWRKWCQDVIKIAKLQISRCYKPEQFGEIAAAELHHFSDASLEGLGCCSYLCLRNMEGKMCTSLVFSKCKVAPSKPVTVPRLELSAAVVSVKVKSFLTAELKYENIAQFFWTDSKVILGYINNDAKRFHIFVANRIQQIHNSSSPTDWRHVKTSENPADLASRGTDSETLIRSNLWWKGPTFLTERESFPPLIDPEEPGMNDPEVKRVSCFAATVTEPSCTDLLQSLSRFSSWNLLRRSVAVCINFIKRLKDRVSMKACQVMNPDRQRGKQRNLQYTGVTVTDVKEAEKRVLSLLQMEYFKEEYEALHRFQNEDIADRTVARHRNSIMKKTSTLYRLDAFLGDGLLRIGGRIRRANLPQEVKHPVVLPRRSHITSLIIDHFHVRSAHSGRGITLNTIRSSGFWIIGGNAAVTSHIWKCVVCRKLRRPPQGQKMSDLPTDRLEPSPPFTYSAVDYFGPFLIKEGRKELKRYGVLFTCLASRAIHIEVASSLTTDSFLNAYRRFVSRRGPVRLLRCDQGTNFIGAKNEQLRALLEMDSDKVRQELLKNECEWINFTLNVPHASHMGGVWERMIRCARNVLEALLLNHGDRLDDELLRTLLVEAEAIVNSRPLTCVDTQSPDSLVPLSPCQLLTMKTNVVMPPPGDFVRQDLYCHRRWRRVQYLANEFWQRWRVEFLPTLQERKKWVATERNVSPNDIVLLVEDNMPRNQWSLGRVVETYKDKDGYIRTVKVVSGQSTFDRPVHKLVLLLEGDTC